MTHDHKHEPQHEHVRAAFKSLKEYSISTLATKILRFVIQMLKNVIITRMLGPAQRGVFSLLTTFVELVVGFGNFGFGLGNTYLLAKHRYDLKRITGNTLMVCATLGLALSVVSYLMLTVNGLLGKEMAPLLKYLPLIVLVIPIWLLQKFSEDILTSIREIHFLNLMGLLLSAIPLTCYFPIYLLTHSATQGAIYSWATSVVVVTTWSVVRMLERSSNQVALSWEYFKASLVFGSRGYVSIVAAHLTRRIDVMIVFSMLGAKQLGLYAVSVSVVEIFVNLSSSISLGFQPIRLGLHDDHAHKVTPIVVRHLLFVMLLCSLGLAVGGKLIIRILFGRAFLPAYSSVLCLLPGLLALSVYSLIVSDMYSYDMPGFVSWSQVMALVANLGLNFLLIPRLGIAGAAISSSVAYSIATMMLMAKLVQLTQLSYRDMLIIKKSEIQSLLIRLYSLGKRS